MFQECSMKMFLSVTAVFILCSLAGTVRCGSLIQTVQVSVNQSCEPWQTECALGCCPYAQGVCCVDGFECCEHGQTCIPIIGLCIGAESNNGQVSLTSKKATRFSSSLATCPAGTTECAPDKCCIYEHAVCCSDGMHCCPRGYRCDLPNQRCVRDPSASEIGRNYYKSFIGFSRPLQKMNEKSSYKSCPGTGRMCPSYMNCCMYDNGEWGCCPNPTLPKIRYGGGECCDTFFGYICCPDNLPTCTPIGCTS